MIKKYKYEILIFLFAVLIRLPNLGYDSFNIDSWKWKTRTYNFSNGIFTQDLGNTLQKYHPGVTLMWLGTAGIKVYNLYYSVAIGGEPAADSVATIFGLNFVQKLFVTLAISFGIAICFYILRKLFGLKFALVSTVLLLFEPFYIALAREFHLEGLMSTFMITSILLAFYYYNGQQVSKRWILAFSAFFASLAILTKVTALVIVPFVISSFFVFEYVKYKNLKATMFGIYRQVFAWVLLCALFVILLWPALWVRPLDVFDAVYRGIFSIGIDGGHNQFYFNKFVTDPGPSFYFVALLARASIFMLPGLIGYFVWARKKADKTVKRYVIYLLIFSLVYLLPMLLSSKKLDRYMLPTLLSLSLVSSVFYYYLLRNIKWFKYALLGVLLLWSAYLAFVHPDYLSYYSPYTGGLNKGIYILEPKWIIGTPEITDYISSEMKVLNRVGFSEEEQFYKIKRRKMLMANKMVVAFPEKYYTQIHPFVKPTGAWPVIDELHDEANYAIFFIYPVWDDVSAKMDKHKLEYYGSIYVKGVFRDTKAYNVYERVGN